MIAVFSGLVAGGLHVLSGPDHLAAVAPLAAADWRRGAALGLRWGVGHASGVIFIGLLGLLFREMLPLEAISNYAERAVGAILIGLGLWSLRRALKTQIHSHEHTHDGSTHLHYHVHGQGHSAAAASPHEHGHAAFGIGTIHGIAGSSHLFGVLPALLLETWVQSAIYLVCFGVGTTLAMIAFSSGIGKISAKLSRHPGRRYQILAYGCSALALAVGGYWLVAPAH